MFKPKTMFRANKMKKSGSLMFAGIDLAGSAASSCTVSLMGMASDGVLTNFTAHDAWAMTPGGIVRLPDDGRLTTVTPLMRSDRWGNPAHPAPFEDRRAIEMEIEFGGRNGSYRLHEYCKRTGVARKTELHRDVGYIIMRNLKNPGLVDYSANGSTVARISAADYDRALEQLQGRPITATEVLQRQREYGPRHW